MTPSYEALMKRKPNLEHLRVFGCVGFFKILGEGQKKLDDRSSPMVYFGTEIGSKTYCMYDPKGKRIQVSREVKFDEKRSWDWSKSENLEQKEFEVDDVTFTKTTEGDNETDNSDDEPSNDDNMNEELASNSSLSSNNEDDKNWINAMKVEMEAIEKNNTWTLVDPPENHRTIGLKWVFKLKKDARGNVVKYKARLVANGYVQKHGVDFDEVFAPVARMETVRMILALAAFGGWQVHHFDVKSAFLNGDLKEVVYVYQPDGFVKKGQEGKVYKLSKALYGLKQAPRAWILKLDNTLKGLGYKICLQEHSVYRKKVGGKLLLKQVYVDDLVVTGACLASILEFKEQMKRKLEMSDLGLLNYYLGIEVNQSSSGIMIKQERFAKRILKEFGMGDCNSTKIPMEPGMKMSKDAYCNPVDPTMYKRIVGSLRYLINTRPDLAYAMGVTSRYMESPKQSHMAAIRQVLRYLKGIEVYGIHYKPPLTWCSQKQETVALSSCEAEFMAASSATCQAIWLRGLLSEMMGTDLQSIEIRVDNKSTMALAKNPVFHGRSKHIDTRYHFILECIEKKQVVIEYVNGNLQKADILIKALGRVKFAEMRSLLGVQEQFDSSSKLGG
ncbi:hypothetical protein E3N88_42305 [Mikania micrantha]|uniref:Uncharacterized protein n=1 Tax=Mikania micrantha TaxID=192012 RepID=A0A5N6LIA6_9ASTR|nr:hypothetical protein E3N88_42305 [Mikania micrantha]